MGSEQSFVAKRTNGGYAYSLNDPANLNDPNGNFVPHVIWGAVAAYKAVSVGIKAALRTLSVPPDARRKPGNMH